MPYYNVAWKKYHCKQLFEDIVKAGNPKIKSHFVGSIVFITDGEYQTEKIIELVIIDGQQRITTFTLLWLAIIEKTKEFKNERLIKIILKKYIINEDIDDKEKFKLRPTTNNNKILKGIIKEGKNFEYEEFFNIIENYKYFLKVITKENFDLLLIGIRKLMFVEISLTKIQEIKKKNGKNKKNNRLRFCQRTCNYRNGIRKFQSSNGKRNRRVFYTNLLIYFQVKQQLFLLCLLALA